MMRTGELSRRLGVARSTINLWSKREELQEFFSDDAKGLKSLHPNYLEDDVLVITTIHHLRTAEGMDNWEEIAEYLRSGKRFERFQRVQFGKDSTVVPVEVAEQSVKAMETMKERDAALALVKDLESKLEAVEAKLEQERQKYTEEIMELREQIGYLKGQLSIKNKPGFFDRFRGGNG